MNSARDKALFASAQEQTAHQTASNCIQMGSNPLPEMRHHFFDVIHSFPHPIPLDLKSVSVMDDMPETAEWTELAGQPVVEQRGQPRLSVGQNRLNKSKCQFSPAGSSTP
jgi:hypothetical protein